MYKLPSDFDGAFFIGNDLESITFAEYSVYFAFENKIMVTVESSLQHIFDQGNREEKHSIPLTETRLMQLIGHTVTQVLTDADGTLEIRFDHGQSLKVFDDLPNYESYSIKHGDITIYV